MFQQREDPNQDRNSVNKWWILMDNQSTEHVLCNEKLLKDIRYAGGRYISIHCNAGSKQCTMKAMLPGFGTVWFDKI